MITIVIPTVGTTNHHYMEQALLSVRETDAKVVSEILVLDNSQDMAFRDFLQNKIGGDQRVRVVSSSTRLRMGENWNRAIGITKNKWLLYLHDDDYLLPENFTDIAGYLDGAHGFVSFDFWVETKGKKRLVTRAKGIHGILDDTPKFASTIISVERLRQIEGWDDRAGFFLDMLGFIKLDHSFSSRHVAQPLGVYRVHEKNSSEIKNRNKTYGDFIPFFIDEIFALISTADIRRKLLMAVTCFVYPPTSRYGKLVRRIVRALAKDNVYM